MSSHALKLVHAGSLGVGGICSCPDGCDWQSARWHATEDGVDRDHKAHIEQEEARGRDWSESDQMMDEMLDEVQFEMLLAALQEEQADG